MKKNKLVLSTLTIALGAILIAPTALAVNVGKTTSKGVAGFTASSKVDDNIQIPEVVPEVNVKPPYTGGSNTIQNDSLALFVPDYVFGNKEIKQEEQTFNVKPVKYTNIDTSAAVQDYYLPPMVIVKDERGNTTFDWLLKVSATPFMRGTEELKGAKFIIQDKLLFNSSKSVAGAIPSLSDQNETSNTKDYKIFAGNGTFEFSTAPAEFLKAEKGAGQFQTTLVPDTQTNYDDLKSKNGVKYTATSEIPSVQLIVPAASIRKQGTYTSTITWDLETSPAAP